MWVNFFICFILALAMLYLPGVLLGSVVRSSGVLRFAFAPLVSVVLYELIAIFYQKLSIRADFFSIVTPALVLSALVFVIAVLLRKRRRERGCQEPTGYSWRFAVAYIVAGFAIGMLFFVKGLDGTDTFMHLGTMRFI